MTDYGFAPPSDRPPVRYVRCGRCNVLQPPSAGGYRRCVACGTPLQRWVAHPPAGARTSTVTRSPPGERPYFGPPAYRGGHPRWSFGPMVWHELPPTDAGEPHDDPTNALRWTGWLCVVTAVAALVAAGAETWRFVLMMQGRTLVLSASVVGASDVIVAISSVMVAAVALVTAAVAVPALVRTHAAAARRVGRAPARRPRDIVLRLVVPGWNVYGAGQIVTEIDRTLDHQRVLSRQAGLLDESAPPVTGPAAARASLLTVLWWLSWIISAGLIIAAIARGLGGSLQAIADTVELHIAVDLLAVVVAGLGAAVVFRFARLLTDRPGEYEHWVVQPPEPTRRQVAADPA